MSEVEEFILENQSKILMALSVMAPDRKQAELILESANIILEQIAEWKARDVRRG